MKSKIVILDDSVLLYQNYIENDSWEKVLAYARGGLTYLIQNNGIRFFASHDWLYKNLIASLELPLYIIDEESGIDGEYDDIQQITEILNSIFPSANGDTDLRPYLKKREAEELYQPIGDYVTDDELSEVLDDYYTKEESDEKYQPTGDYLTKESGDTLYQPIGDYLSANSLVGYATEQWVENKGYIDKIKTINNQSLLGEGNIEISGGTADAYTKAEADNRFQPKGNYVTTTTFITYISNLTQQIESLQEAIEECCSGSGETLYRWITLTGPNDYVCSGTSKYTKEQKQQSTDNGATWQNVSPAEYRAGILIETDSPDCGYEPVIEYRWITVSGEYVCSGTTKYNKEKKQYRVDGGDWIDTSPLQTRRGSIVIETQSPDCGYVPPQYRWWQAPASDYICSGTTKYYKEYYQVSYDGGSTWQNVSPEHARRGAVIESQSTDCGYVPSMKFYGNLYNGGNIRLNCDSSSILTKDEIGGSGIKYTNVEIGTCVNTIDEYTFMSQTYLTDVTLPNTIKTIGNSAFVSCVRLSGITFNEGLETIDVGAFQHCTGLTSVVLPNSVTSIGQGAFTNCSLISATIGSGIQYIGISAFNDVSYERRMQYIKILATTPPTLGGNALGGSSDDFPIYVPAASVNAYKNASGWKQYKDRIQAIP